VRLEMRAECIEAERHVRRFLLCCRGQPGMSRYPTKSSATNEITSPSYGRESVIGLRKTAHVPSRDVPAWLASDARW